MLITFESTTQLDFLVSWSKTHCCVSLTITCLGSKSLAWYITIHYFWKNINCNHLIYYLQFQLILTLPQKRKKILLKKNVVNHISSYYIMYYSLSSHAHLAQILIPIEKFVNWKNTISILNGMRFYCLSRKVHGIWVNPQ